MNKEDRDKREYELALILKSEADLAPMLTLLGQHNGELVGEPRAKNLTLAYEIDGHKEAVFAYCNFKAFGEDAKALEVALTSRQDVLRSMIVTSVPAEKISMSMMPRERKGRPMRASTSEMKPPASKPLSNEALEKKIEEILQ